MQKEQGYGGPDGIAAQEEMPATERAPYSFRETERKNLKEALRYRFTVDLFAFT